MHEKKAALFGTRLVRFDDVSSSGILRIPKNTKLILRSLINTQPCQCLGKSDELDAEEKFALKLNMAVIVLLQHAYSLIHFQWQEKGAMETEEHLSMS